MARMPGAAWRPIPASTTRIASFDLVLIHTMVGSLAGTDGYFRRIAPGVNSHFGTDGQGAIWQWVDTAYRSGANLNGNHRSITIENADMGPGFGAWNTNDGNAVPAFTPQQVEANARICAWAHQAHGVPLIPVELIPDSKPGRRGIGYHRQGVPGFMVPGGEKWSNARGKSCPGPRRIAQIPQIIARAQEIVNGDDMPSVEDIWNFPINGVNARDRLLGIDGKTEAIKGLPVAAADALLQRPVPNEWRRGHGAPYENPDPEATTTLGSQTSWSDDQTVQVLNRVGAVEAKLDAILAALGAGAADNR